VKKEKRGEGVTKYFIKRYVSRRTGANRRGTAPKVWSFVVKTDAEKAEATASAKNPQKVGGRIKEGPKGVTTARMGGLKCFCVVNPRGNNRGVDVILKDKRRAMDNSWKWKRGGVKNWWGTFEAHSKCGTTNISVQSKGKPGTGRKTATFLFRVQRTITVHRLVTCWSGGRGGAGQINQRPESDET